MASVILVCRPFMGRGLLPSDAIEGQEPQPVTVLSYKFWQTHYFPNPDVIGKKLELDRTSYLIVGVAAPRFSWYNPRCVGAVETYARSSAHLHHRLFPQSQV